MEQRQAGAMKTVLYDEHCKLGAKMVSFAAGKCLCSIKVFYTSMLPYVRKRAFLTSRTWASSKSRAATLLSFSIFWLPIALPIKNRGQPPTLCCAQKMAALSTTHFIYRKSENDFFLIANAANRDADLEHVRKVAAQYEVQVTERFHDWGILALQGPSSLELIATLFPEARPAKADALVQDPIILSRTGYTGETGFEIYAPNETIAALWPKLLSLGNVEPCGLVARDLLRLEMGYALYGHELSRTISPVESVAAWTVKFDKPFLGREALEMQKNSRNMRFASAIVLGGQAIAREGFAVQKNGQKIGQVTSGSFSPTLEKPIALVLLNQKMPHGETVEVLIRGKTCPAKVVKLPFIEGKGGMHAS